MDQAGLADAGLAGDEDDAAATRSCLPGCTCERRQLTLAFQNPPAYRHGSPTPAHYPRTRGLVQPGLAWPGAAVYEPRTDKEPSAVSEGVET